jgi:bifunctional DNA-binding transcriptional regulator/antitoxin component of YhaV-PrlF toxin-antitoxin module
MRTARCFRSGNTVRITLPRSVRHALKITAGDVLALEHIAEGEIKMTNASQPVKRPPGRPRKFQPEVP